VLDKRRAIEIANHIRQAKKNIVDNQLVMKDAIF
jgi:hypothetical protein